MVKDKDFGNKNAISASRLDLFLECSYKYAFRYLYKLPDKGNDGANRGSVAHDIFEILSNKRHKHHVEAVIKSGRLDKKSTLWKLVEQKAKKYGVDDVENLSMIDEFIVTGLKYDFFGPPNTIEIFTEKYFDFEYCLNNVNYRIKGYIDKLFLVKDGRRKYLVCKDYKSSKRKFDKEKMAFNHQAMIYQLAIERYLFPDIKLKNFDFFFLKFADDPIQSANLLSPEQLVGYELWLTNIQKKINNFDENDAQINFAANDQVLKITRCGKEGFKKTGEKYFICEAQLPFNYFLLQDKAGEILKTSHYNDLVPDKGQRVVEKFYPGCQYFFNAKGQRIRN
jgi:hypothetical protein